MTYKKPDIIFTQEELSTEIWKKLPESIASDAYVSNLGRVKRRHKGDYIITLGSFDKVGYLRASFTMNKVGKTYKVHRLVALMFIGELEEGKVINHINNTKNDNRLINLEIVTSKENTEHFHSLFNPTKYSSVVGIRYHKGCDRWGFNESGMCFTTEEEAIEKYNLFKKGLYNPETYKNRYFKRNKDKILDTLYLLKNNFLIKQIKILTGGNRATIRSWENTYKDFLIDDYTPVTFNIDEVEKEVYSSKSGKASPKYKDRVGRIFTNAVGDSYKVIKEIDNICTIKFDSGEIIENIHWDRLRRALVRKPK